MIDGFVLAGGRSQRFGSDKAAARVDGLEMALWVARALAGPCERVALVRRVGQPPRDWTLPDGRCVPEVRGDEGDHHPLWGVAVALAAATTPLVLLAPCDLPGLRAEHARALADAGPCCATDGVEEQPLLAVLPRAWLDDVVAAARAGQSVRSLTRSLPRVHLPAHALRNVNQA